MHTQAGPGNEEQTVGLARVAVSPDKAEVQGKKTGSWPSPGRRLTFRSSGYDGTQYVKGLT